MKNKRNHLMRALLTGVLPLILLTSCLQEEFTQSATGKGDADITFSLALPGKNSSATRALTEPDENEVKTIDVLVFKENGGEYVYTARCSGTSIANDGSDSRKKNFTVSLRQGKYDLVILANARDLVPQSTLAGKNKQAALDLLTVSNTGKWIAKNSDSGYKPIPMWGNVGDLTISESTGNTTVRLTRMIARVDVQVTGDADNTFKLTSVHLYNYNTKGSIAPASLTAADWDTTTDADAPRAVKPNVPGTSTLTKGPLLYDGTAIDGVNNKCVSEIYLFEAENHTGAGHTSPKPLLDRTCLVVGGLYNGESSPTYYRVDFSSGSGTSQVYKDVLRNHQYIFSISKVSGAGFDDPDTAFESAPVNIEANVLEWNDGQMGEVIFDGQYMLAVSKGEFSFARDAQDTPGEKNALAIFTDYAPSGGTTGWMIEKIVDATTGDPVTWLKVMTGAAPGTEIANGTMNPANVKANLWLKAEENAFNAERSAKIVIAAGRMRYNIIVNQSLTADIGISIVDLSGNPITELIFAAAKDVVPEAKQFTVNWAPRTANLFVATSTIGSNPALVFNGTSDILKNEILSDGSGTKAYNIQPTALSTSDLATDLFLERTMEVKYTVSNGITYEGKSLFIRQMVYNMAPIVESVYIMNGKTHSLRIKANYSWTAEIVTKDLDGDGKNVIANLLTTSGSPNTTNGTEVKFTTVDDLTSPTIYSGTAQLIIKSVDGVFPDQTIDLFCVSGEPQDGKEANAYIINPVAGYGILIPVRPANGIRTWTDSNSDMQTYTQPNWSLGTQIQSGQQFGTRLVWTDKPHTSTVGVGDDAAIGLLMAIGTGPDGYILVMPGKNQQEGNALIAVTENPDGTGDILWSWHIWVSKEKATILAGHPQSPDWMDRNMGAMNNHTRNDNAPGGGAIGFSYMWGRKDPHKYSGNVITYHTPGDEETTTSTLMSVETSIRRPAMYVPFQDNWNGSNGNNSWNNGTSPNYKTNYDPCPYGWRVPLQNDWTINGWGNWVNTANKQGRTNNNYGGYYPAYFTGSKLVGSWGATRGAGYSGVGLGCSDSTITLGYAYNITAWTLRCKRGF